MLNGFTQIIRQAVTISFATIRLTIHTRAAFWMLLASLATATVLPMTLRGDNTAGSTLRLAVTYPPALLFFILLMGTVWIAASAMAREIKDGEMASVVTKPIHTYVIWLGKWLGVLSFNVFLFSVFAALFIPTMSRIAAKEQRNGSLALIYGHQEFIPIDESLRQDAMERLTVLRLTEESSEKVSFEKMLNTVKTEAFRVTPGQTATWTIPLPSSSSSRHNSAPVWDLQFMFRTDPLSRTVANGVWTLTLPETRPIIVPAERLLDGQHHLALLLPETLHDGQATLSYSNRQDSSTVYFDPRSPLALRLQESPFYENLIRALFILFCFIAATSALALTMGVLFSFPVAVFTVLMMIFAVIISSVFSSIPPPDHQHTEVLSSGLLTHIGESLLSYIHRASASTLHLLPLTALQDSKHIVNWQMIQAAVRLLAGIPLLLCAFSAFLLHRKEFT